MAVVGLVLSACARWPGPYVSVSHLSDNPFDQAIKAGAENNFASDARRRLLQRFPPGTRTRTAISQMEDFGAFCSAGSTGPILCRYSQYSILAVRGLLGDIRREYRHHDFTTRLISDRDLIQDVTVCNMQTRQVDRSLFFGKPTIRTTPFKTCG